MTEFKGVLEPEDSAQFNKRDLEDKIRKSMQERKGAKDASDEDDE